MIIESHFALLDITTGRELLEKELGCNFPFDKTKSIPVIITGSIDSISGRDDGTSQEFCMTVESINFTKQPPIEHLDAVLHDMGAPQPKVTKQWLREFYIAMATYKRNK